MDKILDVKKIEYQQHELCVSISFTYGFRP